MASTYSVQDAINVANRSFSRAIEADHASYVANIALNEIWHAYDWRVSIAALPPFWLIPLIQDYGSPFYAVPTDFHGLRQAYLVNVNASPLPARTEMKVIKNIRREFLRGLPRDIGYVPETQSFRVYPQVAENVGSTAFLIDGTYKKVAPSTTSTTLQSTAIPWDDTYISTVVEAIRWAAADVADAPNKIQKKQDLYGSLMKMADDEGLNLGDQVTAPSEGLVGGIASGFYSGLEIGWF
jgi:hypothetical protein